MANHILKNRRFITIATSTVLIFILFAFLQFKAKSGIVNFLNEKIPEHIQLVYDQIEVDLLTGSIGLTNVVLDIMERDTNSKQVEITIEAVDFEGVGYFGAFFGNTISVNDLRFIRPKAKYYQANHSVENFEVLSNSMGGERSLSITKTSIVDGEFRKIRKGTDSLDLLVENFNLSLDHLKTDKDIIKQKIPISYEGYTLSTGNIFVDLGSFEVLTVNALNGRNKEVQLRNLSLRSKYNKKLLSEKLEKEHDFIVLEVPEVNLTELDFGFNSERFFIKTNAVTIKKPEVEIYRDKLIQDDFEQKKLYSRMLREIPIDLDISKIKISHGYIAYSELVKRGTVPGKIIFSNLEAIMNNVSNTYDNGEQTEIKAVAQLMGNAPIELIWNFDSSKKNDAFYVSGVVKDFKSESINQFLRSNLRTEAEGDVQELYFTFSGDAVSASGNMKMKYQDFRFTVLKKDRTGVNKLLTFVGNIFTNDGSNTDEKGYRYGELYAERDATKSFFNYLWLNVMDGIVNTLTGDGKKK